MSAPPVLGIFVGGASRRMGEPKGLLRAPGSDETLVARLVRIGREAALDPVIVGRVRSGGRSIYAEVAPDVPHLEDDPPGIGPLGGLAALLRHAADRPALAVACDMPHVTAEVLIRIARDPRSAPVLAPRRAPSAPWEPLLARYDAPAVRPVLVAALADGVRSFQFLLSRLDVAELPVDAALARALDDWDTPADLPLREPGRN